MAIQKYIDKTNLPIDKRGKILWKNSVGQSVKFKYGNIEGYMIIDKYNHGILTISYKNKSKEIRCSKLLKCQIGDLLNVKTKEYKYQIGERFIGKNTDYTITNMDRIPDPGSDALWKKYQYKCNICGFDCGEYYKKGEHHKSFWTKESAITRGVTCSCCANEITVVGINDITSTDKWMIPYFQGKEEEAKKYNKMSTKRIHPNYKSIPLNLINRKYDGYKAKRFVINHTNQNVWIPNKHLEADVTIKLGENGKNISYINEVITWKFG